MVEPPVGRRDHQARARNGMSHARGVDRSLEFPRIDSLRLPYLHLHVPWIGGRLKMQECFFSARQGQRLGHTQLQSSWR